MIVMAYYLLKVILCSAILFGYYWLALRNKIFHQYNRFYLLASVLLSLLLPIIKINFWENGSTAKPAMIKVLQAVSEGDIYLDNIIVSNQASTNNWTATDWAGTAYFIVALIMLLVLFQTLFVIYRLLKKYPRQQIGDISLVSTDARSTPFSFLNYIFWNNNIDTESATGKQIFKHEVAHIQEKHTYDKLFMNIVLSVFWCNPVFWLLRRELNMIHEFIADKKAVEDSDTASFAAMILQAAYPQHQFSLANNFFYSPIKRRLTMLMKNKNPKVSYWGRVLILPVAVLLFAAFTFKAKDKNLHFYQGEKIKVIIDAGHGGNDHGAIAKDGTFEKEITLAIAKEIKNLNSNNDIEIVLTKADDIFLSNEQKTEFVKKNNAAMYISIHTSTGLEMEENKSTATIKNDQASGLSIWIPESKSPIAASSRLLGSAMLNEFISNYDLPVKKQLQQRHLFTFENNPCPSLYIETAVISNTADLNYVRSDAGKTTIAKNILAAIEKYATANLQARSTAAAQETPFSEVMVNIQHSDTNYLKSSNYKNHALIILDNKEIGNYGADYLERNNIRYNSIVVYSPDDAVQKFGVKGKYGVIKLTQNSVVIVKADSVFVDDKTNEVKLRGSNTQLDGSFSDALIYIDGKEATAKQLKEVNGSKIASVNIVKGENLDDITIAKGKKSVIYVSLKPEPLQEVVVQGYSMHPQQSLQGAAAGTQPKEYVTKLENLQEVVVEGYQLKQDHNPLYVINGKEQPANFNLNSINANDIERIDVLKDKTATDRYGEKGRNGVILITTKSKNDKLAEVVVEGYRTSPSTKSNISASNNPLLGVDGVRIARMRIEALKNSKALTAGAGYSVQGANVYFSGTAFPQSQVAVLNGEKLSPLNGYFDQCRVGSNITFDNVKVKCPDNSLRVIEGYSITIIDDNDKIFTLTEQEASYSGGKDAWRKYLEKNLDASIPQKEGWAPGTYTIVIQFVVKADGSITDVFAFNQPGSKTAEHCVNLVKNSGKWNPAVQNGHPVASYRKQPITFLVTGKDITEVYRIPLKVHYLRGTIPETYTMVSNGTLSPSMPGMVYINGKPSTNLKEVKKENIQYIETYDPGAAEKILGNKYKTGVTFIKTKV